MLGMIFQKVCSLI